MITIPLNTNSSIRILAKQTEPKPERKKAESIPQIGVSIPQAAKLLNIGKPLMSNLIKTGKIRAVKLGKRVVVSVQSLREFVDGKKEPCNSIENNDELQDEEG
jgi:excisionase family DNA binding protein